MLSCIFRSTDKKVIDRIVLTQRVLLLQPLQLIAASIYGTYVARQQNLTLTDCFHGYKHRAAIRWQCNEGTAASSSASFAAEHAIHHQPDTNLVTQNRSYNYHGKSQLSSVDKRGTRRSGKKWKIVHNLQTS